MPDFPHTTRAQTNFLRAYRKNPYNLPAEQWPSPVLLSRWMRHRGFRKALARIQEALRIQADLHFANATTRAALQLNDSLLATPTPDPRILLTTLRLSHLRRQARDLHSVRTGRYKKNSFPYVDPALFARLVKSQKGPPDAIAANPPLQKTLPPQPTPPSSPAPFEPRQLIGRPRV